MNDVLAMWHLDTIGTMFDDDRQAFSALKQRARALLHVRTNRKTRDATPTIRLRSEAGMVIWEGTVEQAAELRLDD